MKMQPARLLYGACASTAWCLYICVTAYLRMYVCSHECLLVCEYASCVHGGGVYVRLCVCLSVSPSICLSSCICMQLWLGCVYIHVCIMSIVFILCPYVSLRHTLRSWGGRDTLLHFYSHAYDVLLTCRTPGRPEIVSSSGCGLSR